MKKLILMCAVGLALPASASAKDKESTWKVTGKGTEVTIWHTEANGPCGSKLTQDGDQTIQFKVPGLTMRAASDDTFFVHGDMDAHAVRDADYGGTIPKFSIRGQCTGTTTQPRQQYGPCATAMADGHIALGLTGEGRRLKIDGFGPDFENGSTLSFLFQGCPLLVDDITRETREADGELIPAIDGFNPAHFYDAKRRRVVVHASAVDKYSVLGGYGKTIVTYNITFKRL